MTSLRKFLQTKWGTGIELLVFFGVALSTFQLGIIIPILILITIGSLIIRKLKYRDIGFVKTDFKARKILLGIGLALFYLVLFHFLITPFLSRIIGGRLPAAFDIKGNIQKLILGLIASWTIAAFGEEIIFRGYLITRLTDLFGEGLPVKILVVILAATAFGFVHYYQGKQGIVSAGLVGMFQSIAYLFDRKKLTIPIIAHGTFDSIGFVKLFLG